MLPDLNLDMDLIHESRIDLSNYCDEWCVEPKHFSQLLWSVQKMDLAQHIASHQALERGGNRAGFLTAGNQGSVAIISVSGAMTKKGSSLSESGSTVMARRALRQAAMDESISGIVMRFDTPGGTVAGTSDLAEDIRQAREIKTVVGFAEDLCASAGMWAISQCEQVFANSSTAQIGSIGTFLGLYDLSEMAEQKGVKAIVIKAGEFKGGGFPGTEVSEEQIAEWQKRVDSIQSEFTQAIATGRNLSLDRARGMVTGLTYVATEAQQMGLIDGIQSLDAVVSKLQKQPSRERGSLAMSNQAASYQEIVSACGGLKKSKSEDSMFLTDCLDKGLSAEQAQGAWLSTLIDRTESAREELASKDTEIASLKEKNEQLSEEVEQLKSKKVPGVEPVGTSRSPKVDVGDARAEFQEAVQKKISSGMPRVKAVQAVNRENPELRKAYVEMANG